jgi:hypothetical protein
MCDTNLPDIDTEAMCHGLRLRADDENNNQFQVVLCVCVFFFALSFAF